MSNVLDETKQQQVLALGRLGWSLRRIEAATGVRRETVSGYLKAAGIAVRGAGGRPAQWPPPKPATTGEVSTDSGDNRRRGGGSPARRRAAPRRRARASRTASCIEAALAPRPQRDGDLAGPGRRPRLHGALRERAALRRAAARADARPRRACVITTAPGEEAQVDYGDGPMVRDPPSGQVPAHAALRPDARLLAQVGAAADVAVEQRRSGRSCTSRPFGASAARRAWSCSTTSGRACSRRTSTTRR